MMYMRKQHNPNDGKTFNNYERRVYIPSNFPNITEYALLKWLHCHSVPYHYINRSHSDYYTIRFSDPEDTLVFDFKMDSKKFTHGVVEYINLARYIDDVSLLPPQTF